MQTVVVMEDWRQFKHYFYKVVAELDEDFVAPIVGTSLQDSLIDNKTGETFQLKLPEKAHETNADQAAEPSEDDALKVTELE